MHDPVGLLFASVNVGLSFLILSIVFYGVRYCMGGVFKEFRKESSGSRIKYFL